ncbi:ParB/RepB/Spo0J family partition protein [Roseomonas hellenica]|uniref:ParB/RepB/Spo0J family partition protein n=1 Tax=Plastoroseomonas hellenica TaxID=2687306 RepID=A0ABS5EVM4_9PROT|nr:ParB/RepB/Spo0J family partition protein [Plastoroseomonas hellenica]MBR0664355.1 ParB/RepB/Spo0J family partition protein [Plastoroseomonas hellenica]
MARGNRGFGDLIAGGEGARPASRLPPRTGILGARENRLAELAGGAAVSRVHELVDPARCRIWEGHNRDYAALSEELCGDLIESFRAQRKQEMPAIVRRVANDPDHDFEVICGARRHWTVSWLRSHDYPDFRFLIEPRELSDEEAFRLADLENRSRKDLTDYERAIDYARAIDRYYDGSQQRMVERLEVSKSWLSRYLELARLPPEVVASFGTSKVIGISHAARLAPLLKVPLTRERVVTEAVAIAQEQLAREQRSEALISAAAVTARLAAAATKRQKASQPKELVVHGGEGTVLARAQKVRGGGLAITVPSLRTDKAQILQALSQLLDRAVG